MKTEKQSEYIRKIRELEEELNHLKASKKYGIVFEEKREDFEERARNALPVLQEVENMRVSDSAEGPTNIIIEGDNYHALSCLRYTHKGKVDVIYIDPPYNTGNKDFIYNDRYVDKEDTYRHSKWLSFMKKRLVLAQELLSESGVIFISIDDNEQAQLKMLCDEVFGEENFVENFIWNSIFRPSNMGKLVRKNSEFILMYTKGFNDGLELIERQEDTKGVPSLTQNNNKERILEFPANYVITKLTDGVYAKGIYGNNELLDDIVIHNEVITNAFKMKGKFKWSQDYLNKEIIKSVKIIIKNKSLIPYYLKDYQKTVSRPTKILPNDLVGDVLEANAELGRLFQEKIFNYPKPKSLVKFLLNSLPLNKSSLILDFFAGSGTTGHAVLELNREDGGNRQFILCSNREATPEQPEKNICRDITYERVKRVATGYMNSKGESVPGLGGKIRYYQTDFIKIEKSRENLKKKFKLRCNELIQIKENTFDAVKLQSPIPGMYLYRNNEQYTMLVYDYLYLDQARNLLRSLDKKTSLYIFSISTGFSEDFEDLKDMVEVKHIPEEILEVYLRIFNF